MQHSWWEGGTPLRFHKGMVMKFCLVKLLQRWWQHGGFERLWLEPESVLEGILGMNQLVGEQGPGHRVGFCNQLVM